MAFLAPLFLALAAFAGVPLLLHLLRRRIGRVVEFPAVRYLARMEQEHSRELKLRNRLLLFLRLLAVLAISLAAARPIARRIGIGHAPIAVAVLLDNSLSTGVAQDGRVVFDSLRKESDALLASLTADDRGWIVTADGRVIGGAPTALRAALATLQPLGGRGDLSVAMTRAVGLVRSAAPRTPVVAVVSDGQRASFRADSVQDVGRVPVLLWTHGVSALRNRAVLEARAEPVRWTPGGSVVLAIASPDSTGWRLSLDGRTLARGRVAAATLAAPTRVTTKLASAGRGWMRGNVELDADALRADDTRWFAVRVAPPPTVAIRSESGPFLTAALGTLIDDKRLARGTAGAPRVVTVAAADAAGLQGPVLLTAPADPLRLGEANRQLARLGVPWRFGAIARSAVLARVAGAPDSSAPATRAFDGTTVRLRYPLVYSPPAGGAKDRPDTVATAGGAPWVVAGAGYVLMGSPITPEATDLPLRAAFVPWLLDALARRLGDDGRYLEARPGTVVRGVRDATGLEYADGRVVPLTSDRLTVPSRAGVYFLRRDTARIGAVVVNPEAEESDGEGMGSAEGAGTAGVLASLVRGADVMTIASAPAWRRAVYDRAAGQALLLPLLLLALGALLAESWLSGR